MLQQLSKRARDAERWKSIVNNDAPGGRDRTTTVTSIPDSSCHPVIRNLGLSHVTDRLPRSTGFWPTMASPGGGSFATSGFACYTLTTLLIIWGCCLSTVQGRAVPSAMSTRVVETQYGRLRGVLYSAPDPLLPQVEAYLGLQYASLLGGQLRFMPPTTPMEKWDGIRVALRFRAVCPQRLPDLKQLERKAPATEVQRWKSLLPFLENQQEDCLSLNIYVPARGKTRPMRRFVHSGYLYLDRRID